MRKLVSSLFITLDGVTQDPFKWQFDNFDADMMSGMQKFMDETDTVLMGRVTYQDWAPYWPTATGEPFAAFINNVQKYIFSTTLDKVDWQNSTLVKGDAAGEVAKLKAQPGKNIGVTGSPTLARFLVQNDLLDELMLMIHPVVAGSGKRLFGDNDALKRLKLVKNETTGTGVVMLTYEPR